MLIDTQKDLDRIRFYLSQEILKCKAEDLDKHYMSCSMGTFTRRELAKEIEDNTEVGKKWLQDIIHLTLDRLERSKEKI